MGKDLLALRDDREEAKKYDDDVIRNYKVKHVHGSDSLWLVCRILIDLSFLIDYALKTQANNSIMLEITGPRRPENGLVMPGKITAFAKSAAI